MHSAIQAFGLVSSLLVSCGILKLAISFTKIHRHRAMKWDLFELIVNKDECLCTWPSAEEQHILGVSIPPIASPLRVLWILRPKET